MVVGCGFSLDLDGHVSDTNVFAGMSNLLENIGRIMVRRNVEVEGTMEVGGRECPEMLFGTCQDAGGGLNALQEGR